jgi:hypothetical protein
MLLVVGTASLQFRVMLAGTFVITGGVLSPTLICCDAVALLPQASVAVHVLVRVYEPAHEPLVLVSAKVMRGVLSQLSVAIGVPATGTVPPQLRVVFAGMFVSVGGVRSPTEITWEAVVELPHASVAVQTLVRVNWPGQVPRTVMSRMKILTLLSQLSVAVILFPSGSGSLQFMVVLAGTRTKIGGVVSSILITWEAVAVLPQLSEAVQVLTNL